MQQYDGLMGGLFKITEWIMRFTVINLLLIASNVPIVLIVLIMMFTPSNLAIVLWTVPLAFCLPFLFFPSIVAAFATIRDWVMNVTQLSLTGAYWKYVKENYKTSLKSGMLLTVFWIIWAVDFYFFYERNHFLSLLMLLLGLWLFVYTIIYCCLSVHFQMGNKNVFKNAFFVSIGNFFLFMSIILVTCFVLYLSFRMWFIFPFFALSVMIFLYFLAFYHFTLKVQAKAMKANSVGLP